MTEDDKKLTVVFREHGIPNLEKSKAAGRLVNDYIEVCDIRGAADKQRVGTFPAHAMSNWVTDEETGDQRAITYAERFKEQYQRFKAKADQIQPGTPLSALGFIPAKVSELRALNIYTVEQLASVDGQPLKNLGMGGRKLKEQAEEFLAKANSGAAVSELTSKVDEQAELIRSLQAQLTERGRANSDVFSDKSDDDLKQIIKDKTGAAPKGNPKRETLVRMATEAGALEAA